MSSSVKDPIKSSDCKYCKVQDDKYINVLLLGETGVGKSTFVNAFANYLAHHDFKIAERRKLITLISSRYEVIDKHGKCQVIELHSDEKDEYLDKKIPAAQGLKSYVFPVQEGSVKLRLIDTPGIGNRKDINEDNEICENIFRYVSQFRGLHGICLFLKPTATKEVYLNYFVTQIFSRLDKSSSGNLIFVFTNTRDSGYRPGDTFLLLRERVGDMKTSPPYVDISLDKNVFCLDNEAFRFLGATKKCVKFNHCQNKKNRESWRWSVDQCHSLIKYIVGDNNGNPGLKPYLVRNTEALRGARTFLVRFFRPLSEISKLIRNNLSVLQNHKNCLNPNTGYLDGLRQKLYIPVVKKLIEPATVCLSKKCAADQSDEWHYKQICHESCLLKDVPADTMGTPALEECAAFDLSTRKCVKCHCYFYKHMHTYYMTEMVNDNAELDISSRESLLETVEKLRRDVSTREEELKNEHNIIVKTCVRFAQCLQNNAIATFSSSYREYIKHLMDREKSLALSDLSVIDQLQNLLKEYRKAKKFYDEALSLKSKVGECDASITPSMIGNGIKELYKLKHNGDKIRELCEDRESSPSK